MKLSKMLSQEIDNCKVAVFVVVPVVLTKQTNYTGSRSQRVQLQQASVINEQIILQNH